jgi:hypothetical protein
LCIAVVGNILFLSDWGVKNGCISYARNNRKI